MSLVISPYRLQQRINKNLEAARKNPPQESPQVPVRLSKGEDSNQWIVICCPYCGEKHFHGAGSSKSDPLSFLGHRLPHCTGDKQGLPQYELVLADQPIANRQ